MYPSSHRTVRFLLLGVLCGVGVLGAFAQELEIAISPSPVGSGGRAAGMADAFVAVADDATAASWNPAGLVQLERPEISIVGSYNGIFEDFRADWHSEVDSQHSDHNLDLNFLSAVYPLPVLVAGRNAVVSLSYQRKYDFSRRFEVDFNTAMAAGRGTVLMRSRTMNFRQSGGLGAITPAFAIELTHRLSIGAALNLWRTSWLGENGWEQTIKVNETGFWGAATYLAPTYAREEYRDFRAENMTFGVLWNPTDRWSLGARYDTAFTGEVDYKRFGYNLFSMLPSAFNPFGSVSITPNEGYRAPVYARSEKREVRFPDSLALGVAWRPNDRLTLALDVTRTDWHDFYFKDGEGRRYSLVDAGRIDGTGPKVDFDPTYTVRVGAEYVMIPRRPTRDLDHLWSLRGGLFYDEEPATGVSNRYSWVVENFGFGQASGKPDRFYGLALGAGLLYKHRVNMDLAYQFRYGDGVNADFLRGVPGFREDVYQHRVLLSTVIYF